ncbi:laccase-5-like [Thrips palmi]|uniref:Laccase-5-like n=1 Tax=Thrips palmi TaxID=161013 RepID=A0A6P8YG45_THRPL|nr:laccase-5-like [Thrips palmi]
MRAAGVVPVVPGWTLSLASLGLALAVLGCAALSAAQHPLGPCYRECTNATPSRVCAFSFVEEMYNAVNQACGNCSSGDAADCSRRGCIPVDGVERTVYSINRMVPGPAIHVCAGDVLQVDLHVHLHGHADTMHWHGLRQRRTPFMDGVTMVTQCPVMAGQSFRYKFEVDAPGTYFYHSHNGLHKVNGVVGALVARAPPEANPLAHLYDLDLAEHTVVLMDWLHVDAEFVFPGLHALHGQRASSILINGKGDFQFPDGSRTRTPLAEFRVRRGLRYRFRLINSGGLSCPLVFRVLRHKLVVIASDAADVQPLEVDTLYIFSGERYDVILEASQDGDAFWIHCFTGGSCPHETQVEQVAILRYEDGEDEDEALPADPRPSIQQLPPEGVVLNSPYCGDSPRQLCVTDLQSVPAMEDPLLHGLAEPEHTEVQEVQFYPYTDEELYDNDQFLPFLYFDMNIAGAMNNVSYMTAASPLLTQPGESPTCRGCADRADGRPPCVCTQVVPLPLGKRCEVILVDVTNVTPSRLPVDGMLSHPMHLHGYSFRVLAVGSLTNITRGADRRRFVVDNAALLRAQAATPSPPAKDTVMLPRAGYAIIRFEADNPGVWFFHCHFQYHMAVGMEMVFQVGNATDFVKAPADFPRCGNYLPD